MMTPEMDYKAIEERVEASVRREKNISKFVLFAANLGMYVVFLMMSWQMFLANGGTPPQWADMINWPGITKPTTDPFTSALLMVSIGWGIGLFMHVVSLIIDSRLGERSIRDRAMGREMRKAMTEMSREQEKRKGMMRLTDDGELEAVEDVMEEAVPIQQNRKG